jgi:Ca2+-binding RTX toxin-like protein
MTYDAPALGVDFSYSQFFPVPVFPPLGAELGGRIYAVADFAFGFDTSGLRNLGTPLSVLGPFDGFFVSDRANADGTGSDVAEVRLGGSLTAGAKLEALLARAGVNGGVFANVDFNLHDQSGDGRVRAGEILNSLALGPIHVFDVSGQVDAALQAFWEVGFGPFAVGKTYRLASFRLVDFNIVRPTAPPPPLAVKTGSTLTLLLTEQDDDYSIVPGMTAGSIVVRSKGVDSEEFIGIGLIVGDALGGNDTIRVSPQITIPVDLAGGAGDDVLFAGGGPSTLRGGTDDDQLVGGPLGDLLYGDEGDDFLIGGLGDDLLEGGTGMDRLEGGDGDDTLRGQGHNDVLLGQLGDDVLEGGDGDDLLEGGRGEDMLLGGNGVDRIVGGRDVDFIF